MNRYVITITEIVDAGDDESASNLVRFQQTVDQIDIPAVITAVNGTPLAQRRAKRSDAGKPRKAQVKYAPGSE